jgi:hypothetical protein
MKHLIQTDTVIYDKYGNWLGREVIEVDGFTKNELPPGCPECGYKNGYHGEYFVKTGQHPGGEVNGYYKKCSQENR